jgi:hypothetical protein
VPTTPSAAPATLTARISQLNLMTAPNTRGQSSPLSTSVSRGSPTEGAGDATASGRNGARNGTSVACWSLALKELRSGDTNGELPLLRTSKSDTAIQR